MTAPALALWLLAAPGFADRCPEALARAQAARDGRAAALAALALEPPEGGRLPAVEAAAKRAAEAEPGAVAGARAALEETLAATCAHARLAGAPAPADRAALEAVLARPQFAGRKAGGWAVGQVLERLWDVLKELLQSRGVKTYSSVTRVLFLAAVLLWAGWAGLRLLRGRRARTALPEAPPPPRRFTRDPSAEELLEQARAALEAGQAREAVRLQLLALLAELDRRGLADRHAGLTNRELAEALASKAPGAAEPARRLLGWFDRAFYGEAALAPADAESFAREAAALRGALPGGGP